MLRVTLSQTLAHTQRELAARGAAAARLQADLASGVRIRRPSDDPRAQKFVLQQQTHSQQLDTRLTSLADARARLEHGAQIVLHAQELFVQAKTIALQSVQSTEPAERRALAAEVDRLRETLLGLAQTAHDGQPLLHGLRIDRAEGQVVYDAHSGATPLRLNDGTRLPLHTAGAGVFQPGDRALTLLSGGTGTNAGAGTSTARGVQSLQVVHTATLFAPGSGVQAGLSSVGGDTILGPSGTHHIALQDVSGTGAFGTVVLNGGAAVAFSNTDADLAVTGPSGELVHLNLTAVTPGFAGNVALTAEGSLSVDGGVSNIAIDFSAAQAVIDSRDGSVTYLNTQATRRTGTEAIEFMDTLDAFQVLDQLSQELRDEALSSAERGERLSRRLGDIDRLSDHLLAASGEQSSTLEQLDHLQIRAEDLRLQVQQVLSETQDTDFAATTLALQEQQTWMQFSLATITRLFDISVLNYL